jgi:hypothetical protein
MKRALFAIASVGIVATAVGVEAANAQYAPASPAYTPPPAYSPPPAYRGPTYPPIPTRYGRPGYGYGPGPYPDAVIVNPVTGRWCRTASDGYQFCWTP